MLKAIPIYITSPALVPIGLILMHEVKGIDFGHPITGYAAFFAIVMQPFTISISNGIYIAVGLYLVSLSMSRALAFIKYKGGEAGWSALREPLVHPELQPQDSA